MLKKSSFYELFFSLERPAASPFFGLHSANPHDSCPVATRCGDQGACAAESKIPARRDDTISAQGTGRVTAPALHACGKGRAWCPISPSGVSEGALYGPSAPWHPHCAAGALHPLHATAISLMRLPRPCRHAGTP